MIDFGKVLKRAWQILWEYKILWIFAVLLVLFGGGANGRISGNGSSGSGYQFDAPSSYNPDFQPGPWLEEFNQWAEQNLEPLALYPEEHVGTFVWIGVGLVLFILLMSAVTALVRYPAETAIVRMVDEYEQSGARLGFKQGWKLGWSRRAFRIWVIDLVLGLPVFLFLLLMIGVGVGIYFTATEGAFPASGAGVAVLVILGFLVFVAFLLGMIFLGLLRQFFFRKAALEEAGIGASFREGWAMFKANWKSAALLWLIMLGLWIGFGIASLILAFLFIPVYLLLAIPAVLVAVIPGLIAFGIGLLFGPALLAVAIGLVVTIPFFFLIVTAPLTLISAGYLLYVSNVWTLAYREMKALQNLEPVEALPPLAS